MVFAVSIWLFSCPLFWSAFLQPVVIYLPVDTLFSSVRKTCFWFEFIFFTIFPKLLWAKKKDGNQTIVTVKLKFNFWLFFWKISKSWIMNYKRAEKGDLTWFDGFFRKKQSIKSILASCWNCSCQERLKDLKVWAYSMVCFCWIFTENFVIVEPSGRFSYSFLGE